MSDISLITYSAMAHTALDASKKLEESEIRLEIIDLRTLLPLDRKTIFDSVKKTSLVIVLYEATKSGGTGAEVSALISEDVFRCLDGPIVRISPPDISVPYSPANGKIPPQVVDVVKAAEKLAAY